MSFEDFFTKKKIDLQKFKLNDCASYNELEEHYNLMGSKSFDYTKKYLFNKLRAIYPLKKMEESAKRDSSRE